MRIGELARRSGASTRMLRYYEEQGLLSPARSPAGYRAYAPDDVARVAHVRTLLGAGLSTGTIAELLPCMDADGNAVTVPDCPELVVELLSERDRLDVSIAELTRARGTLESVIATAPDTTRQAAEAAHRTGGGHGTPARRASMSGSDRYST